MPARGLLIDEITDELYAHAARLDDAPLSATTALLAAYGRDLRQTITVTRRGAGSAYAKQQKKRNDAESQWASARYKEDE